MNIQIKPYNDHDEQALLAIIQLNVPTYFAQEEVEDLREYLRHHIDMYFTVFDNDTIIGGGGINRTKETKLGALSWAFLHPDYQQKGIGGLLLEHRLNILKQDADVETIRVRTSQVVYPFFEKKGFKTIDVQADYWAKGLDLYEMVYLK
ncbi:MAG: GNAT family N-acetyltransferase [Flavobacteriaceae bacterium]|jgi:N-acetylglutamate synthase-like GNAT family acetyltransferase|nr:GNAT family N-acetyltransferase [Flavobacteriaceae bacterium]